MTIAQGQALPDTTFVVMGPNGPEARSGSDIFLRKNVALFGLPGAYTPVCHKEHLPGIIGLCDVFKENGIDTVACTSVNDIFVMNHWANELHASEKVTMLADGNADFALSAGLAVDMAGYGLGVRSNRYAMLISDGIVKLLSVEDAIMTHDKSSAARLAQNLVSARC